MSNPALIVQNIIKIYKIYEKNSDRVKESILNKHLHRDHYALNDISLEVQAGQIYGIMGTNGSGKSTLLKIITGVLNQTSGSVTINGKISALLELGAGFNIEYTGIENIYLNGMLMGYTREEIASRIDEITEFAAIGDYVHQPVKTYSSGMFARLAFAVAINVDPDILIVDEALSVGDMFFQSKCYKKFEDFKNRGKTILFVSHDLGSIIKYCDRVLLINNGVKVMEGTAQEAVDAYKMIMANKLESGTVEETAVKSAEEEGIVHKTKMALNPDCNDYGNRQAEIIDFYIKDHNGIISNTTDKEKEFEVWMKIKFNQDVEQPIFAFTIRDIKGTEIMGTNTHAENYDFGTVKKDSVMTCSFKQKMDLQGGNYLLCLGCTSFREEGLMVFHRLYDVCSVAVVSIKNTVGYYDCNSKISIGNG